jgi:hypothetical protein
MKPIRLLALSLVTTLAASAQNTYPFPSSGNVGIGTTAPATTLEVAANKTSAPLAVFRNTGSGTNNGIGLLTDTVAHASARNWGIAFNSYAYGDFVIRQSNALGGDPFAGGTERLLIDVAGNVGIGTVTPRSKLQVLGPITAGVSGGSTQGIDYVYGQYSSGALFVLGSQYSSAASFFGFGVKAKPGAVGYLSSTEIPIGRSAIEADGGHISFLTGENQTSSDGGAVNISERVRINHLGNVGIGTTGPSEKLTVYGTANSQPGVLSLESSREDGQNVEVGRLSAKNSMGEISRISLLRGDGSYTGQIAFYTRPTNESALIEGMRLDKNGNLGIGTTNPTHKLAVNGTIKAKEVIVETTGWSDYVFADDYALQPLAEVEAHIKTNKHLPGIPSATEVAAQGVSIGDMQARLLAKIEELTLYQIAQEKLLKAQTEELTALRAEIRASRK